jgi:hypothetical protein
VSRAALALLVTLTLAGAAEATLPAPPFALDVEPTRVAAGETVRLTLTPRGRDGRFDVYLMWALSPEAGFLTDAGVWSPRPVALRAGVPASGNAFVMQWRPGPGAEIPLALLVVPAGADPLARFGWTYRPEVVRVHVTAPGGAPLDVVALATLAALTLLACALVLRTGRPFFG